MYRYIKGKNVARQLVAKVSLANAKTRKLGERESRETTRPLHLFIYLEEKGCAVTFEHHPPSRLVSRCVVAGNSSLSAGWRARALVVAAWSLSVLFSVPIIFLYEEKRIQVWDDLSRIYTMRGSKQSKV